MKYLIAYKQNENTYLYVNNIGSSVGITMNYTSAIDFITKENASNVCKFLNEYDNTHEYIIIEYQFSLKEV
jgi:hypothetical protein